MALEVRVGIDAAGQHREGRLHRLHVEREGERHLVQVGGNRAESARSAGCTPATARCEGAARASTLCCAVSTASRGVCGRPRRSPSSEATMGPNCSSEVSMPARPRPGELAREAIDETPHVEREEARIVREAEEVEPLEEELESPGAAARQHGAVPLVGKEDQDALACHRERVRLPGQPAFRGGGAFMGFACPGGSLRIQQAATCLYSANASIARILHRHRAIAMNSIRLACTAHPRRPARPRRG